MEELAGSFGIDVLDFAVLSNHFHAVLRNRPDVVAGWSDEEVARRWWNLFPQRRDDQGRPAEPKEQELQMLLADRQRMKELRRRLSHISWFMRCLAENIARRANAEDECGGRFWQGRFRCQKILDESALLACSIYVDLNPIRAGIARTPETSRYTSVYDRIRSRPQPEGKQRRGKKKGRAARAGSSSRPDGWLSPVPLRRDAKAQKRPKRRANQALPKINNTMKIRPKNICTMLLVRSGSKPAGAVVLAAA